MQFWDFLGCTNGGMNVCSHPEGWGKAMGCYWTAVWALCARQVERGLAGLRAGKEFVLLTAVQAVACENLTDR
ncbi:hypothetical protein CgunFtcFv8_019819 [Champsocephalus gunnari]|uniref:Uncharacterized protein n=1 Tax=Champsocephalus gunnari TaxID=52237 RepID=A0AAN8DG45_CHAGU|nr:hypothetical protein CgunFtcFv8_019819 [Champsocephalus gunnari]